MGNGRGERVRVPVLTETATDDAMALCWREETMPKRIDAAALAQAAGAALPDHDIVTNTNAWSSVAVYTRDARRMIVLVEQFGREAARMSCETVRPDDYPAVRTMMDLVERQIAGGDTTG